MPAGSLIEGDNPRIAHQHAEWHSPSGEGIKYDVHEFQAESGALAIRMNRYKADNCH